MTDKKILFEWITQKEASEISGKTLKSINELVRNKRLKVNQIYGKRLVSKDEILNFKPKKAGRRRKDEKAQDK